MSTKENFDASILAIKYLGRISMLVFIGSFIFVLASIGYNIHFSMSKEKIEVQTTNSNLTNK